MFGWLKRIFYKEVRTRVEPDYEGDRMKVIMECFRTGKIVTGSYDEQGSFQMLVHEDPKDPK